MSTVRVDFLCPKEGRTGSLSETREPRFSLLPSGSAVSVTTAGEAGIVLKRFFSEITPFLSEDDDNCLVRVVVVEAVREAGVTGVLRVPGGLVKKGRVVVAVVFLTGVAAVIRDEAVRSVAVEGAKDTLLGFADMPSFFLSSVASTELNDVRFR